MSPSFPGTASFTAFSTIGVIKSVRNDFKGLRLSIINSCFCLTKTGVATILIGRLSDNAKIDWKIMETMTLRL